MPSIFGNCLKHKYRTAAIFGILVPVAILVWCILIYTLKDARLVGGLFWGTLDVGIQGMKAASHSLCYDPACGTALAIFVFMIWLPFLLVAAGFLVFFVCVPLGLAYMAAFAYPISKRRKAWKQYDEQCDALEAIMSSSKSGFIEGAEFDYDWVECAIKARTLSLHAELANLHLKDTAKELLGRVKVNKHLAALILDYATDIHVITEYADAEPQRFVYAGFDEDIATSLVKPGWLLPTDAINAGDMPYFSREELAVKSNNTSGVPKMWLLRNRCALSRQVLSKLFD